jgi:hypothetical protein
MMQIVMTGYLSVKKSTSAILTLVLIPLTLIARSACLDVFRRPLAAMSLRAATDMDAADSASGGAGAGGASNEAGKVSSPYLSPAMKFDASDLPPLQAEAADVAAYLAGTKAPPPVEDTVAEEAAREAVANKQHKMRAAASTKKAPAKKGGAAAAAAAAAGSGPAVPAVARARSTKKAAAVAAPAVPADTPTATAGPATTYEEAIRRANSGARAPSGEV